MVIVILAHVTLCQVSVPTMDSIVEIIELHNADELFLKMVGVS